jgi:hypothetical protein
VIVGIVLAIWQPWRGTDAAAPAPSPSSSIATSPATTPSVPAAPATSASAPAPDPTPSGEAPVAPCTTSDIAVLANTDKDAYGAGELPQLSITLTNNGEAACLINVGTSQQSFVISSGSDIWWRSTDCQTESSDQVVQLAAGQTVSSVTPLAWDRTRSSVDTCGGDRPTAQPGYYNLSVSIGGIEAADTRTFVLL